MSGRVDPIEGEPAAWLLGAPPRRLARDRQSTQALGWADLQVAGALQEHAEVQLLERVTPVDLGDCSDPCSKFAVRISARVAVLAILTTARLRA